MQSADLLELRDDLSRECSRLQTLVTGLSELGQRLEHSADAVEASALRLHSFYTGVERMLLLISRVVNGGTPAQGEGWHRRLLERMAMATDTRPAALNEATQVELQEYLRFRHLVRNLYADELRVEPIQRLIAAPAHLAEAGRRHHKLSGLAQVDCFREHLSQAQTVVTSPQRPLHRRAQT